MNYTQCVTAMNTHLVTRNDCHFKWLVWDKRKGKAAAAEWGIRTAQEVELPPSYVIKPHNSWSSQGITMIQDGRRIHGEYDLTMIEEMIMCENGDGPSRMFNLYVFDGIPMLMSVYKIKVQQGIAYYNLPNLNLWHIDKHCDLKDWLKLTPTKWLQEMMDAASCLSALFPVPVRVDFLADAKGIVFDEFCLTPGLHVPNRLTPEANEILGQWYTDACPEEYLKPCTA
jgi:hypothetical protein